MLRNKYRVGDRVAVCLPDGSLLKAKIKEIIPGTRFNCYLVQYNGAYALVAERDLIQRI